MVSVIISVTIMKLDERMKGGKERRVGRRITYIIIIHINFVEQDICILFSHCLVGR